MSQVEALQADFADAINAKPCEYMNNVVGLLESVNYELVCMVNRRGVDQGVVRDAQADQLIGIAVSKAAFRQRLQLLQVNVIGSPAFNAQVVAVARTNAVLPVSVAFDSIRVELSASSDAQPQCCQPGPLRWCCLQMRPF